jgi:protein-tyrosine phosphatase
MQLIPGPLVLSSANRSGEPDAITGQGVLEALGDQLELIVDDGRCRYGQPSSVVRVRGDRWELLREGVVPAGTIERVSASMVLFICTGNTCRSPLAEGLCRKLLAERLGCTPAELHQRGFVVLSAGISAMMGGCAAHEAIDTANSLGVDLQGHRTQPLTAALLAQADYAFTMTFSHLQAARARFARGTGRLQLLSPQGLDIADPIGGDREVYQQCAAEILQCLEARLPEFRVEGTDADPLPGQTPPQA